MIQKSYKNEKPTLFIVSTPIGNLEDMTFRAVSTLKSVDVVFAEDTRVGKKLLSNFDIHKKVISCHKFNEKEATVKIIKLLKDNQKVALITDRGTPLISDPGAISVQQVIDEGFNVVSIPGSTAFVSALVTSGLDTSHFFFYGFLDHKDTIQKKELEKLKNLNYLIILYESPHRFTKTLKNIYEIMGNIKIIISREITKYNEEIFRGTVEEAIKAYEEIKGEIVIILDNTEKKSEINMKMLLEEINELIENGTSKSESVKQVASKYNISKNKLYNTIQKEGE